MAPADQKNRLQSGIDKEGDMLVGLLSNLVRIPSDNPPGSTVEVAHFVKEHLERHGSNQFSTNQIKGTSMSWRVGERVAHT